VIKIGGQSSGFLIITFFLILIAPEEQVGGKIKIKSKITIKIQILTATSNRICVRLKH